MMGPNIDKRVKNTSVEGGLIRVMLGHGDRLRSGAGARRLIRFDTWGYSLIGRSVVLKVYGPLHNAYYY